MSYQKFTNSQIETLVDIFITEMVKTLDRYQDSKTALEIYRICDQAIFSLTDLQTQAKEAIRRSLEAAGENKRETDQAVIRLTISYNLDKAAWRSACTEAAVCRDAQAQFNLAKGRLERLQSELSCRFEIPDVEIKLNRRT